MIASTETLRLGGLPCCTKTVWLNYAFESDAAKVASKFSAGVFKVLNQVVKCEGPTRSAGHNNWQAWTVRLTDVPGPAQEWQIRRGIPSRLAPENVELAPPSYIVDPPTANAQLESLLLQAGPLESWEGATLATIKRHKATARFTNDADARQAVVLFHNKPLPFNRNGKLTVQLVSTARLKISTRVYDAAQEEIATHEGAWRSQHLRYNAYPPARGLRVLKLEGEISTDVASAKATLERIGRALRQQERRPRAGSQGERQGNGPWAFRRLRGECRSK